jgi:hypothetical protein
LTVALAVVAHDPRNDLLAKTKELLPSLSEVFDGIGVLGSVSASPEALSVFEAHGAIIEQEREPDGIDSIGRRRRGCVEVALRAGTSHLLFSDLDHVLRWFERDPDDVRAALGALPDADFTIFGRPPSVFAQAPAPLRETEGLCNAFYEQLTGRPWELFIALRGMSSATARLVVDGCDEATVATDVAWPLFVESHGCSLAYREVDVPYENHRWYASGTSEKERMEADPQQWSMRFLFAKQMMDAFVRWGPQPSR